MPRKVPKSNGRDDTCYCSRLSPTETGACVFRVHSPEALSSLPPVEFLKRMPALAGLPEETWKRLKPRLEERTFKKGELIAGPDQPSHALLVLRSGRVRVARDRAGLWTQTLTEVGPGRPLNLSAILSDTGMHLSVIAKTEARVILVPGDETVSTFIAKEPLIRQALHCMAMQYRSLSELCADLSLFTLKERVILYILDHAPFRGDADDGPPRKWEMSHADLASLLGGTREEITRILGSLKRKGLISIASRSVEIVDPAGLEKLAPRRPHDIPA